MHSKIQTIHMVGIGGSGMSGIAEVLLNLGYKVQGSDLQEGSVVARLRELGAHICIGHNRENLGTPHVLVKSTAVGNENPEVAAARELGIPVIPRAEMLAELRCRGIKLGVLSNKFDAGVQDVIGSYFPDLFGAVHGECVTIPRKPDPAGLLQTIGELGAVPARTVYVGDSPVDVEVSRNAGVFSVAVSWGYHDAERLYVAGPDRVISRPCSLLELV